MKTQIRPALCLLIGIMTVVLTFSCGNREMDVAKRTVVSGRLLNYSSKIAIFNYEAYKLFGNGKTAEIDIDADGLFKMIMETDVPVKGSFSLGKEPVVLDYNIVTVDGRDSSIQTSTFDFKMVYLYLEPGDSLVMDLDVNEIESSLEFNGQGSVNNRFVNAEEQGFNAYRDRYLGNYYNITYREPDDYKSTIDKLSKEKIDFIDMYSISHPISKTLKENYIHRYKYETVTRKIAYPGSHVMYNDDKPVVLPNDYYDFLNNIEFSDQIGNLGIGYYYFVNSALNALYVQEGSKGDIYDYAKTKLPPQAYYEFIALSLSRDFKRNLYDQFDRGCPFPEIALMVKEKYGDREGMLEGNLAPSFTMTDINGINVSLDDLKGKYIYIDFWATWCGPCKEEIPYLKKLVSEMGESNIHFVSISFDKKKDYDVWESYVRDNELTGIQLFAGSPSQDILSKAFNIQMIPRFVLLDREGRIVDANAPKPSDSKLISLFNELGI